MMTLTKTKKYANTENTVFAGLLVALVVYPFVSSLFNVLNVAYFLSFAIMSLSLCLVWGYAGILSFGQAAFFGIGAYCYGIVSINYPAPSLSPLIVVLSVLVAGLTALALGYFMFYGGVNDVFASLVTLIVSVTLETFLSQTGDAKWRVGEALIGGFNGLRPIPSLSAGVGDATLTFFGNSFYILVLGLFMATYVGLRVLVGTRWGYGLVALRENRERTETFGYNVRLQQALVFGLGGVLAGLSGVLYASWGNFVTPSSMGLTAAIMPVILVAVGGRKSLTAATISTIALLYFSQRLSSTGSEYSLLVLGVILVLAVLFVPRGVVVALLESVDSVRRRKRLSESPVVMANLETRMTTLVDPRNPQVEPGKGGLDA